MDPEVLKLLNMHNQKQDNRNKNGDGGVQAQGGNGNHGGLRNIKFNVNYKNRQETLRKRFSGNDRVSDVAQAIADEITGGADSSGGYGKKTRMNLVFGKKAPDMNDVLSSIGHIKGNEEWNHPIHVSFKVIGGAYDEKNNGDRVRLAHFQTEKRIIPTLEPDCIYGYNEKKLRVKMPCGHVFDSQSIFKLTQMYVNNLSKSEIKCPMLKCKQVWEFDIVAAAGDFNNNEKEKFFGVLSKRALLHSGNYKECKNCKGLVEKPDDLKMIRVRCAAKTCTNRKDFCWCCGQDWVGGGFSVCGNKNCSTEEINDLLQNCETVKPKYLNGVKCPEFRVCPRCLTLVQWDSACKHIKCWGCNKEFCYVCCGLKADNGNWPCGSYNDECPVHKRQSLK